MIKVTHVDHDDFDKRFIVTIEVPLAYPNGHVNKTVLVEISEDLLGTLLKGYLKGFVQKDGIWEGGAP